ncbi:MAG TPA: hydroxymethylbilane synthase [Candidatus Saccharimonadales bacterium]|nr:hydroxymethylbilane synthase [Candidatus Saccharimonadales bacterium]
MKIGTRGSALALAQARQVASLLRAAGVPQVELVELKTSGDRHVDRPLAEIAGLGAFTRELEEALLREQVDLAVHSLKDLPTALPPGLALAAVPAREDVRDVLVSRSGAHLAELPAGSRVATSSLRRSAQVLAARPDLACVEVRGNVPTRLRRVEEGRCEAVVLALAGLKRLGLAGRVTEILEPSVMLPAVAQGALGLEVRAADAATREPVSGLNDVASWTAVRAERELLRDLGGGCRLPLGAWGRIEAGKLRLDGCACAPDGSRVVRAAAEGSADDPEALGRAVGAALRAQGAEELLRMVR